MLLTPDISRGQVIALPFGQINVAASQTDVALIASDPSGNPEYAVAWDGAVIALAASVSGAVTAGTLAIAVTLDGTKQTAGTLNFPADSTTLVATLKIALTAVPMTARRRIGVKITTAAGFLPVTTDLTVVAYVLQRLDGI